MCCNQEHAPRELSSRTSAVSFTESVIVVRGYKRSWMMIRIRRLSHLYSPPTKSVLSDKLATHPESEATSWVNRRPGRCLSDSASLITPWSNFLSDPRQSWANRHRQRIGGGVAWRTVVDRPTNVTRQRQATQMRERAAPVSPSVYRWRNEDNGAVCVIELDRITINDTDSLSASSALGDGGDACGQHQHSGRDWFH